MTRTGIILVSATLVFERHLLLFSLDHFGSGRHRYDNGFSTLLIVAVDHN